jgi:hypothetical protein
VSVTSLARRRRPRWWGSYGIYRNGYRARRSSTVTLTLNPIDKHHTEEKQHPSGLARPPRSTGAERREGRHEAGVRNEKEGICWKSRSKQVRLPSVSEDGRELKCIFMPRESMTLRHVIMWSANVSSHGIEKYAVISAVVWRKELSAPSFSSV